MAFFKKLFFFFFKLILGLIILLIIAGAGLFIYYLLTIQTAEEYLPREFLVFIKVKSIREIYDNVIDLKAMDTIFSNTEFKEVYNSILEFKSTEFSRNELFNTLLDLEASIVINNDFTPTVVFNVGPLSLITRIFPLVNLFYKLDDVDLTIYQKGKITYYSIALEDQNEFYFSFANNLVFLATKAENIESLYKNYETKQNIVSLGSKSYLTEKIGESGFIEFYFNTNNIIENIVSGNASLEPVFNKVTFNDLSILSFQISNEKFRLDAYTKFKANDEVLDNFLDYNPTSLRVLKYFPEATNIYTCINYKSFMDLYKLLLSFQGQEFEQVLADVDGASKLLFGNSVDDLIFSWIGTEAGALTVEGSEDPVIFLRIADKKRFDNTIKILTSSILLTEDSSLIMDNVRLRRIDFPPFIRMIVELFVSGIEMPYFIVTSDSEYLFLSMNSENLARILNDYKSGKVLIRSEKYKSVTAHLPKNANLFMYYDLSSAMPRFLLGNTLINQLLRLYERGVISIYFSGSDIKVNISAEGIAGNKTIPFPGFPRELKDGLGGPLICEDIGGSRMPEIIYIDNKNYFVIQDTITSTEKHSPIEKMSTITVTKNQMGATEVFVYSRTGTIYKFDAEARPVEPFPTVTGYNNSFTPLEVMDKLLLFSLKDKSLYYISKEDGEESAFNFEFKDPLLFPPAYEPENGLLAFYPKSFSGDIYLTNLKGTKIKGWPQEGGGISLNGPKFVKLNKKELYLIFLTQAGLLNMWDIKGKQVPGFPLNLDRVYFASPQVVNYEKYVEPGILALDEDGYLTLIDFQGRVKKEKRIEQAKGKENKIVVFDIDNDGIDEIFIYGAKNYIIGLDNNFVMLPGFTVTGGTRPNFIDINFDGAYEMLVGGFDNMLYIYTLHK